MKKTYLKPVAEYFEILSQEDVTSSGMEGGILSANPGLESGAGGIEWDE